VDLDLDNIQGNILPGFNKDHQAFLFVRFQGGEQGARWLSELQPQVASAREVEAFRVAFTSAKKRRPPESSTGRDGGALRAINATWINVAISFAGLRVLPGAGNVSRFPQTFRSNRVPGADESTSQGDVHALLIVASDYAANLDAELERQRQRLAACGVDEVWLLRGDALLGDLRGHEHFGFKDGISQPQIDGTPWGNGPPVAAGEFILGQRDQTGQLSGAGLPAWTQNGSFLAFVQMEQHVESFWSSMREQAPQFGIAPEELAEWIVGRKHDAQGEKLSDPPARVSHIGRGYTRWLPPEEALRHRMIRRGIPYGAVAQDGQPNSGQRGLCFLAYQADPERQFEHVWNDWFNAPGFPVPGAGRDGLVGQVNWPYQSGPTRSRSAAAAAADQMGGIVSLNLPAFVTPHYGGYFFAPSIDGLLQLAGIASAAPAYGR
jgi:Dyp-type peroxidase family